MVTVNLNNVTELRRTVESVLSQSFSDYEYIVIDGGSTDGSVEVIEEYKERFSWWVSEKDSGIYNAMNKGIRAAKGEYLYFLNSGDTLCSENVLSDVFATHPNEDVIIGRLNFTDNSGVYHQDYQPRSRKMTSREFLSKGVSHQASFIKRTLFTEYGLYDESYRISADWKFFYDVLVKHKCSYRYIPVTVANFDGGGISSKNNRQMMDEINRAYMELMSAFERRLVRMKKRTLKLLSEVKNFGPVFVCQSHVLTRLRRSNRYRQKIIYNYLKQKYSEYVSGGVEIERIGDDYHVWVCWLQGEKEMPPLVKSCYESFLSHYGTNSITLLDGNNYSDYIEVPLYVKSLYQRGRMTAAHLSDIIRFGVLNRYGSLWLDLTVLMTGGIHIEGKPFFSVRGVRVDDSYMSDYMWAGYCMGGASGNPLFSNVETLLLRYWKDHDRLIDYFLLDYLIRLVYERVPSVRKMIDENEPNNPDVSFIHTHFDEPFSQSEFERICSRTQLHKLSWKGTHSETTPDGRETYYGHILNSLQHNDIGSHPSI